MYKRTLLINGAGAHPYYQALQKKVEETAEIRLYSGPIPESPYAASPDDVVEIIHSPMPNAIPTIFSQQMIERFYESSILPALGQGGAVTIASSDPTTFENVTVQNVSWDFGDSTEVESGSPVTHQYDNAGEYSVRITPPAVSRTKENILEYIVKCGEMLDRHSVPTEDRWAVLPKWMVDSLQPKKRKKRRKKK